MTWPFCGCVPRKMKSWSLQVRSQVSFCWTSLVNLSLCDVVPLDFHKHLYPLLLHSTLVTLAAPGPGPVRQHGQRFQLFHLKKPPGREHQPPESSWSVSGWGEAICICCLKDANQLADTVWDQLAGPIWDQLAATVWDQPAAVEYSSSCVLSLQTRTTSWSSSRTQDTRGPCSGWVGTVDKYQTWVSEVSIPCWSDLNSPKTKNVYFPTKFFCNFGCYYELCRYHGDWRSFFTE